MHYPSSVSAGSRQFDNHGFVGGFPANEPAEGATFDPLIGRKVWTRWPEDNNFYEAVITDSNPSEISPVDIRWDGEDLGISYRRGHGFHRAKKSFSSGDPAPGPGRGWGSMKGQSRKELLPSQNGIGKKLSSEIELPNTEMLAREVERVFDTSHPDPVKLERAKKKLKEQEQLLVNAIVRLADASNDEDHLSSRDPPMDQL